MQLISIKFNGLEVDNCKIRVDVDPDTVTCGQPITVIADVVFIEVEVSTL